jgi:hypothetical protein
MRNGRVCSIPDSKLLHLFSSLDSFDKSPSFSFLDVSEDPNRTLDGSIVEPFVTIFPVELVLCYKKPSVSRHVEDLRNRLVRANV